MAAIKKLIVPTDFSKTGNRAIGFAFDLAGQLGARVILTTVIERAQHESRYFIDLTPLASEENLKQAQIQAKKDLEKLVTASMAKKAKFQAMPMVADNSYEGIMEAVEASKAQLIVIADHGMSKFERFVLGSTTDRIMRTSTVPVLLVKSE